jgi:hypothetical protein
MSATATCRTSAGVFTTRAAADQAIAQLKRAGYRDDQIGLIHKDTSGNTIKMDGAGETHTRACEGSAIGAAIGAAGGAAVGAGILAGVIPVIGPVLAIGTLGTVLLNAAGGAAIAGLAGALVGWGIPEEDAEFYQNEVKSGRYLVTVECGQGDDARDLLTRNGAYDRASSLQI